MNRNSSAFIGGIPTSGKTWLANWLSQRLGIAHVRLDDLRADMMADPALKPWVRFFLDRDGEEYWRSTSCDQHWRNVTAIAEALWPRMLSRVEEMMEKEESAIFESVCILPHLAKATLRIPGLYLLGSTFEETLERNRAAPRWSQTDVLIRKDAEMFFYCERGHLKMEAEKHGLRCFEDIEEAEKLLLSWIERSH